MTLRTPFCPAPVASVNLGFLPAGGFSTIASPFFREFVVELNQLPSQSDEPSWSDQGPWKEVDEFLYVRFSGREGFKVIIKTGGPCDWTTFQLHVMVNFPLLVKKGCIYLEVIEK